MHGRVDAGLVRLLPAEQRTAAARRVLTLPKLEADPQWRLTYSAFLPWDEARELGQAWIGHPEAEFRARALVALCDATRFDRSRLQELLELLAARKELLGKEKELTRARDALNADRRRLPMVEIEKPYVFEGPEGEATLLDLFDGRCQLILIHFMFDPQWEDGCASCTATRRDSR